MGEFSSSKAKAQEAREKGGEGNTTFFLSFTSIIQSCLVSSPWLRLSKYTPAYYVRTTC